MVHKGESSCPFEICFHRGGVLDVYILHFYAVKLLTLHSIRLRKLTCVQVRYSPKSENQKVPASPDVHRQLKLVIGNLSDV
jgi:hypothetical protein